jgi:hypothetical protein
MRLKMLLRVLVLVALFAAYYIGYKRGFAQARRGAIIVGRDAKDIAGLSGTGGYSRVFDSYLTKANWIPSETK